MNVLKRIFTPPVFEDERKTQQAYLLHAILWALVFVPPPYVLFTFFAHPEDLPRVLIQATFAEVVNLALLAATHRGFVGEASIVQVAAFWLFFTVTSFTGSGVQGEAYLIGYTLVITVTGILLGGRGAFAITALSLASGALMIGLQGRGLMAGNYATTPLATWMISLVLFPIGAILQRVATRMVRTALARARDSEEKYRLISRVSSDYNFSTELDSAGNIRLNWVAGAFESMTGYTFEEYSAHGGWLAHLHPDDKAIDDLALEKLKSNQQTIHELRTYTKSGTIQWVRVYAHPMWDEASNRLRGIIGAVQDITDRKRIEESLRESESTYRQAIVVAGGVPYRQVFAEDDSNIYTFIDEGIYKITGCRPEEFNDTVWNSLVQERILLEDLQGLDFQEAIQSVRSGRKSIWKCEYRIKARDGRVHWVFEAAVDLRDEHGIARGSIGLYQDITARKEAEEALKYERDLLQFFLDNIPDTVYFKDTASRFLRVNKAQAKFLKLERPEDAIGKTDLDFQPHDLAAQFIEEEKRIIESGEAIINRVEFNPTADGSPRWLSATKAPVRDSEGSILGTIGISRDITPQKLAEERETDRRKYLEKVLELGKQVTEVKDLKTTLERIRQGVLHDLGFDRPAIFLYDPATNSVNGSLGTDNDGRMVEEWDYKQTLDHARPNSFMIALAQPNGLFFTNSFGTDFDIPEGHEMHDVKEFAAVSAWAGEKPVAIITVDNLPSGRPIGAAPLEALRLFAGYAGLAIENSRLNAALQSELDERQRLIDEFENKNAELERFTYTVSHDLKSPLVTITGFLGFLEKDALSGNLERVRGSINRISGAARKMQSLLNDLLELSRIGRLINPPEDVPFAEVVNDALDHVQGHLAEADALVEIERDFPIVRGDRVRLTEVVQNLVENAVKYADPARRLRLQIGMSGFNEKGWPIFHVRDNGIGIEPRFHERIFGLFNKLDAQSDGSGIGLSLVKRIIEIHNGRIWVESEKGMGAAFLFSLPPSPEKE